MVVGTSLTSLWTQKTGRTAVGLGNWLSTGVQARVSMLLESRRCVKCLPFTLMAMVGASGRKALWREQTASQGLTTRCGKAGSSVVGTGLFRGVSHRRSPLPMLRVATVRSRGSTISPEDLAHLIPTALHCSGGRALRKRSIMILSTTLVCCSGWSHR